MNGNNLFAWDYKKQQNRNLVRWIKALLSGEYKQGRNRLYNPKTGCHCVNGVALREFGFNEVNGWFYFGYDATSWRNLFSRTIVPHRWVEQTFGKHTGIHALGYRNDAGRTFAELAGFLIEFLPESAEKTELQFQIADKLKSEAIARQNMGGASL